MYTKISNQHTYLEGFSKAGFDDDIFNIKN